MFLRIWSLSLIEKSMLGWYITHLDSDRYRWGDPWSRVSVNECACLYYDKTKCLGIQLHWVSDGDRAGWWMVTSSWNHIWTPGKRTEAELTGRPAGSEEWIPDRDENCGLQSCASQTRRVSRFLFLPQSTSTVFSPCYLWNHAAVVWTTVCRHFSRSPRTLTYQACSLTMCWLTGMAIFKLYALFSTSLFASLCWRNDQKRGHICRAALKKLNPRDVVSVSISLN